METISATDVGGWLVCLLIRCMQDRKKKLINFHRVLPLSHSMIRFMRVEYQITLHDHMDYGLVLPFHLLDSNFFISFLQLLPSLEIIEIKKNIIVESKKLYI